ncbi:MAG: hypothetical protein ACI835_001738 [Planctomycetota bacterium]|jgi:hypothetical protein
MPVPVPIQPRPEPKKRGCGCLAFTGLGCIAFLFGATLAALVFAPGLLGGLAASWLEENISSQIAGEVRVGHAELAWVRPQTIHDVLLLDADGHELSVGKVTLPSMLEMLDESKTFLVQLDLTLLDLRRSEKGGIQLLESIGLSEEKDWEALSKSDWPFGARSNHLRIDVDRLLLPVDALEREQSFRTDASAPSGVSLFDVDFRLTAKYEECRTRLSARFGSLDGAKVEASSTIAWDSSHVWQSVSFEADTEPLACDQLALVTGWSTLSGSFGKVVSLHAAGSGRASAGFPIETTIQGDKGQLGFAGQWKSGELSLGASGRLDIDFLLASNELRELWSQVSPRSGRPAFDESTTWSVHAEEFSWSPGWGDGMTTFSPPAMQYLPWTRTALRVEAPADLQLVDRATGDALLPSAQWTAMVSSGPAGMSLDVRGQPDAQEGRPRAPGLERQPPPAWTAQFTTPLVPSDFARADASARIIHLNLLAPGLPAGLLDHLRGEGGVYAELFGAQLDVSASLSNLLGESCSFEVQLESPSGMLKMAADRTARGFTAKDGDVLRAEFPLAPLARSRVLQDFLPWFDAYEALDASARVQVVMSEFELPRDRQARALNAKLDLAFGGVTMVRTKNLCDALKLDPGRVSFDDLSLSMTVKDGRVEYELLPLHFGTKIIEFTGAIDLATAGVDFDGEVPVSHLFGTDLGGDSEQGDSLTMPVKIGGTVIEPRLDMQMPIELLRSLVVEGVDGLMQTGTARMLGRAVGLGVDEASAEEGDEADAGPASADEDGAESAVPAAPETPQPGDAESEAPNAPDDQ